MEERSLIERLARHLALGQPEDWPDRAEDAASILAVIKQPDPAMRAVGDERAWRTMIDAALRQRWHVAPGSSRDAREDRGFDEEGEIQLPEHAYTADRANWVHIQKDEGKGS